MSAYDEIQHQMRPEDMKAREPEALGHPPDLLALLVAEVAKLAGEVRELRDAAAGKVASEDSRRLNFIQTLHRQYKINGESTSVYLIRTDLSIRDEIDRLMPKPEATPLPTPPRARLGKKPCKTL